MVNLKPLADRLVIEPVKKDVETFAGGELVLPDTAKEKPQQGKVLAVGPGARDEGGQRIPRDIAVGDTVIFAKYAGTTFKRDDGKELLLMKQDDVLAILA